VAETEKPKNQVIQENQHGSAYFLIARVSMAFSISWTNRWMEAGKIDRLMFDSIVKR
jgi:hypothetical protein